MRQAFARRPSAAGRCRWCDHDRVRQNGAVWCPHCDTPMGADDRETCVDCSTVWARTDADAPPQIRNPGPSPER